MTGPRLSVVIATYNRGPRLRRLIEDLGRQSLAASDFEVIVVDDGSAEPVAPLLAASSTAFPLRVVRQENGGAAKARDRGARLAGGDVLVILDDDMRIPAQFLAEHAALHAPQTRRVVLGPIEPAPDQASVPVFEAWNAHRLLTFSRNAARGEIRLRGNSLCTGNVSLRLADYLATGGFDPSFRRSEDAELGLRLEQAGAEFVFAAKAPVFHDSDHADAEWLRRGYVYGQVDLRIARKHARIAHADPFRYWFLLPGLVRPLLKLAVSFPRLSRLLAAGLARAGALAHAAGLAGMARMLVSVAYAMEYFRGVRDECGGRRPALLALRAFLGKAGQTKDKPARVPRRLAAYHAARQAFAQDLATRKRYEEKYSYAGARAGSALGEVINKIGLQISFGYRAMWFFREAGHGFCARATSRMMRHLYGCDIHWEAELAPGVVFIHGMGICLSHRARVGPGCILAQNVTLGMGIDPQTREQGAPTLEADVHVGGGASLIGPIVIGAGTKIMPNAVVTARVPPRSLVEVPAPRVFPRGSASPGTASEPAAANDVRAETSR